MVSEPHYTITLYDNIKAEKDSKCDIKSKFAPFEIRSLFTRLDSKICLEFKKTEVMHIKNIGKITAYYRLKKMYPSIIPYGKNIIIGSTLIKTEIKGCEVHLKFFDQLNNHIKDVTKTVGSKIDVIGSSKFGEETISFESDKLMSGNHIQLYYGNDYIIAIDYKFGLGTVYGSWVEFDEGDFLRGTLDIRFGMNPYYINIERISSQKAKKQLSFTPTNISKTHMMSEEMKIAFGLSNNDLAKALEIIKRVNELTAEDVTEISKFDINSKTNETFVRVLYAAYYKNKEQTKEYIKEYNI